MLDHPRPLRPRLGVHGVRIENSVELHVDSLVLDHVNYGATHPLARFCAERLVWEAHSDPRPTWAILVLSTYASMKKERNAFE